MNAARARWPLAGVAILLGAGAAIVGNPRPRQRAAIDVRTLAAEVARESDHVSAIQLAEWIKAAKPGLQVLDVRSAREYETYHIPTARSMPLETLVTTTFDPDATLVLYSEGGGHAAQAWVLLRALGYRNVFALKGGLDDWLEDVMHPVQQTDVTRYFGAVSRKPGDAPLTVETLRRHGC
ncbi:MAG TPA: rhodanese-like domain-containing protein [Vicinamibacterales bacterium]|jgi:rhodanese-related sulfurtransferase|nr:rhodanese-like domain-containing protein [Vicinamibacterales bacterium]